MPGGLAIRHSPFDKIKKVTKKYTKFQQKL
jgi:hypothetical protein